MSVFDWSRSLIFYWVPLWLVAPDKFNFAQRSSNGTCFICIIKYVRNKKPGKSPCQLHSFCVLNKQTNGHLDEMSQFAGGLGIRDTSSSKSWCRRHMLAVVFQWRTPCNLTAAYEITHHVRYGAKSRASLFESFVPWCLFCWALAS